MDLATLKSNLFLKKTLSSYIIKLNLKSNNFPTQTSLDLQLWTKSRVTKSVGKTRVILTNGPTTSPLEKGFRVTVNFSVLCAHFESEANLSYHQLDLYHATVPIIDSIIKITIITIINKSIENTIIPIINRLLKRLSSPSSIGLSCNSALMFSTSVLSISLMGYHYIERKINLIAVMSSVVPPLFQQPSAYCCSHQWDHYYSRFKINVATLMSLLVTPLLEY